MDIDSLRSVLVEPKSLDEDARRRERILNIILLGSIIMLVLFDVLVYCYAYNRDRDFDGSISFWLFSLFPAFFIFLYSLSRRGFFVLASYLLIGAFFIGNSYAGYRWGIDLPTSLLGYGLLIIVASILISTRFAFVITAIIASFVLPVWYLQMNGLIVKDAQSITFGDGISVVILYFLVVVVAWLSNREIEKSLVRARSSEEALKEERDSLEIKVEQRTQELRDTQVEKMDQLYRFAEFGQLASGLFHDLLNLLNVVSLRVDGDRDAPSETKDKLKNALSVQGDIDQFRAAIRKQLSNDDIEETFSIVQNIDNVVKLLSYKAKQCGIRLNFHHEPKDDFEYYGSPLKFHQVVLNLVLNALESFVGPGNYHVSINLSRKGQDIILQVQDNGVGMPPSISEKIFEPFFTTKKEKGIGIGLAITKRIIEVELRGSITVKSAEAEGTLFILVFPNRLNFDEDHRRANPIGDRSYSEAATS